MDPMLHDIDGAFDNHYVERAPRDADFALVFRGRSLLMQRAGDEVALPAFAELGQAARDGAIHLFDIDGAGYFLVDGQRAQGSSPAAAGIDAGQVEGASGPEDLPQGPFSYEPLGIYRWIRPRAMRLAIEVGAQLAGWYRDNRFCGRCGARLRPDQAERMLRCPQCGNTVYPRINPGIIVGVVDGDRLLLTKYAGRGFSSWALVAGFTEIGESLEQTVAREVLEETGLHVKDIRYFTNQPWPRSSSLLVGFFATLDGPGEVRLDDHELACAEWVPWQDVPHEPDGYSMTRAMMRAFHERFAADSPTDSAS